ncbi:head-tail adaptor protein [Rhizobium sp. Leaf371]|uniref:phage head closure protein n=1 Tax=Rhizobium sp. Leaf371 TaxID=1736355 RepID=UPI0007138458|nr:phage head closure protein [Rhizobium sp. Leaf371]KQS64514.1 head-tail adaptor protein [Rhizobium sp. Leaf371]
MRAGKLDKTITIERRGETVDDYGTVSEGWTTIASVRAQVIQSSTEEFLKAAGTTSEQATVFRLRHRDGIQPEDRITYAGQAFDIKELKELGRREGLDLRCVAAGE